VSHIINTPESATLTLGGQLLTLERIIAALPPTPAPKIIRRPAPIKSTTCAETKPRALALLNDTPITVSDLHAAMKAGMPGLSKDTLRSALAQLETTGHARRLTRGETGTGYIKYVRGNAK
jgi:hypothetical protein